MKPKGSKLLRAIRCELRRDEEERLLFLSELFEFMEIILLFQKTRFFFSNCAVKDAFWTGSGRIISPLEIWILFRICCFQNQIGMAVLVATAVAIYFYTIHAVKQETFLEEIDEEVAKELAEAEAAKQKN